MTHTVMISQPYLPTDENEPLANPYKDWCADNFLNPKEIYFGFGPDVDTSSSDILELSLAHGVGLYAQFECPAEAMLFKLTWGGK